MKASKSTGSGVQINHINVWGWQAMWFDDRINVDGTGDSHLSVRTIKDWINIAVGECPGFASADIPCTGWVVVGLVLGWTNETLQLFESRPMPTTNKTTSC